MQQVEHFVKTLIQGFSKSGALKPVQLRFHFYQLRKQLQGKLDAPNLQSHFRGLLLYKSQRNDVLFTIHLDLSPRPRRRHEAHPFTLA